MTQEREGHQRKKQTDAPFLSFLRELILPRARSGELCAEMHKGALFTQNPLPPNVGDFVSRLVGICAIYLSLFSP